jgi:rare lipoprotein A (peptidoglycan hydrolase)
VTLLWAALKTIALALLGATSLVSERGIATRFGDPGDPLNGPHLSCTHQKIVPEQLACAHRTLPCGTVVVVQNVRNRKLAVCEVLDRGPFGALLPTGQWVFKIRPHEPGDWRGIIDLSPAVAKALDFNGRERVRIFHQPVKKRVARKGPARAGAAAAR